MEHRLVGFDRKIRLSWLDATADWAAQGAVGSRHTGAA